LDIEVQAMTKGGTVRQLEVPGAVIEYVTEGSGPPVLLTHGALVADAVIVPLAGQPALTSSHQLIGYRRRGYATGGGEVTDGTTIADYAADAAALLDHLGVQRAHVVGHSSGALISLQLAHDHPDLVASLALLEPPLADPDAHRRQREQVLFPAMERYRAVDREIATDVFFTGVFNADWKTVMEAAIPGAAGQAVASADAFLGREVPAIGAWSFGPAEAATINVPVLSVLGTASDPFFSGSGPILHEWFRDVDDFDLVGANHQMQVMDPAGIAAALAGFFSRNPL
jgi:pimeloyl-ACP methyl ester carboxylesterase